MLSRRLLRIKVIKSLYSHFKSDSDSMTLSEKQLNKSIDKTYELYHMMMWLVVEIKRYAAERIEIGKNKKLPTKADLNPNTKFVDNMLIDQIEQSIELVDFLKRYKLSWEDNSDLIKSLYTLMVESDIYNKYMNSGKSSYKDDVNFIAELYETIISEYEPLEDALEETSILWSDDSDFAIIMTLRTIEDCRQNQEVLPLLPQFKNDDDMNFGRHLFRRALSGYKENLAYVEKFTQNWDVERIAFIDNIIMTTALAEMLEFESIPVKVTMDEYIEISKYYSTPGSSPFINGVLDKIVESLNAENKIRKTGRGLN